ncbi:MAG: fumarylacetoacetate hydrolase family protein [Vulcanimicrobiaceae bacterium]
MPSGRLTRHLTSSGARWAFDGRYLPSGIGLSLLLALSFESMRAILPELAGDEDASDPPLPPLDPMQEVWASGVTYVRSREARKAESKAGDVYALVYDAERPELFFKSIGWRVIGPGGSVRIRKDARWNVPEPELVLVVNRFGAIVGYTAGNDMSSRDIEGENPLYLPQAKIYDGSCALGPAILLAQADELRDVTIGLRVRREDNDVFVGTTSTAQMKRGFDDLAVCLSSEYELPAGVLLMTGTGVVPPDDFSLSIGDGVLITVGPLSLQNDVAG